MDWMAAITLGALSSLHCVGMCGPIAMALHVPQQKTWQAVLGALFYNLGRIATYAMLGIFFGFVGKGFVMATSQHVLSIFAGTVMILLVVLPLINQRFNTERWSFAFIPSIKNKIGRLFKKQSLESKFYVGFFNGFLPCGMVYIALAGALGQGDALGGGAFMMFFGFGTLPLMAVASLIPNLLSIKWRGLIQKWMPAVICVIGVMLILRGLNLGIPYVSPVINEVSTEITECE
jgi:sulfite exporter TauE/SafE